MVLGGGPFNALAWGDENVDEDVEADEEVEEVELSVPADFPSTAVVDTKRPL